MAGRIVTLAQQKGGSGKTTLAAHLAVAFARGGLSVAVLDVDPQGSLGEWFEAREKSLGEDATGLVFRTASGWGARREARTSSPARRSRRPTSSWCRSSRPRSTCGRPSRRWR